MPTYTLVTSKTRDSVLVTAAEALARADGWDLASNEVPDAGLWRLYRKQAAAVLNVAVPGFLEGTHRLVPNN